MNLRIRRVAGSDVSEPAYQTEGSAGADLSAALVGPVTIEPGHRALVPTGFSLAIPRGFEGQIRPRSGLALRHGVTVLNAPGTVDSDYRGEVKVLLVNLGHEAFVVRPGDRIAQLIVAPVVRARFEVVEQLDDTDRGAGGYGSTGV
ncbi:MAG: dUTP diphosphatase [Deltaproteobacteria bacterium HGW-Deltaproteobacteria-20]|nr:MAG: dUTP diphosphatase [Deltaproteobacteria bacterium HGW-Deltaproteobacteria-20]